jgi:glycosyltransferase involved in cell wall biosynthesis
VGNPLRILHVVVNMNRGGAETLIMNLYRNIDRTKVQFDFLTCKEGVFDSDILEMGGRIHRIPYISDVGHFNYVKGLKNFFNRNNQYKIVHSHMDKMTGLVLREAKKAGIPFRISHSHNTSSEGGIASRVYKWYVGNFINPNATNLFACSNLAAKWLFNYKSQASKILKNGIECDRFVFSSQIREEVRVELKIAKGVFVLGHVGRFAHQKNHAFLIKLFAEFNKVNQESILLLVGDGPLRSDIENLVLELKLEEKVKFIGIRSDIQRILQAFDVFVFPSLHEGLPVSLIEAQASGLPCLISDNVSKEVDLGMNLVDFISLTDKKQWVKRIEETALMHQSRSVFSESIVSKGYDIRETAAIIEKFYLSISG